MPYRLLPHTADIAVELWARDEAGLREAGVEALRELLVGTDPVRSLEERAIEPRGADATERLVHFLSDVLYLYDAERFLPARASPSGIFGEPFDPRRHAALREVKAVTFHRADVQRDREGRLRSTIVFDV